MHERLIKPQYSINDAAKVLDLSRSMIYRLIKDGELEAYKIGSRTFIDSTELHRFVMSRPRGIHND